MAFDLVSRLLKRNRNSPSEQCPPPPYGQHPVVAKTEAKSKRRAPMTPVKHDAHEMQDAPCEKYAFIDVETPNRSNSRICSIGVVVTNPDGIIESSSYFLCNPEQDFDYVNIGIHGITSEKVSNAMVFPELWSQELEKLLDRCYIIAHNAKFDLGVLYKTFNAYGMTFPEFRFACTRQMASDRGMSGRLADVCGILDVSIENHHNASCDAMACANVFWKMASDDNGLPAFSTYRFGERKPWHPPTKKTDGALLATLIEEVVSDGEVTYEEAVEILDLIASSDTLRENRLVEPIAKSMQIAMEDGVISAEESDELTKALRRLSDPIEHGCAIEIPGMKFVLTGDFQRGSKEEVAKEIEERGGEILQNVTMKCNYVVVGALGSSAYSMGNYGTKVTKALDYIGKGKPIHIVGEKELSEAL